MTVAWTDDLRERVWSLSEKGMSHRAIAKWIGEGLTKGSVSGQITRIREMRGIPAADNYREIDVVTRRDQIELSHRLLARLLKYHGDNPPDAESALAVHAFDDRLLGEKREAARKARQAEIDRLRAIEEARRAILLRQDVFHEKRATVGSIDTVERPKRMIDVAVEVAAKHGITVADLKMRWRRRHLVIARQEVCYRMAKECNRSTTQIGQFLGGRDHTTVIHSIQQYEKRMKGHEE